MDITPYKAIFQDAFYQGLSIGMASWFFAWGMNRVYLRIKTFFSF